MKTLYVVEHYMHFEYENVIGIFDNLVQAKKCLVNLVKKDTDKKRDWSKDRLRCECSHNSYNISKMILNKVYK